MRRDFWLGLIMSAFAVIFSYATFTYITDLSNPDLLSSTPVYMSRFLLAIAFYTLLTVGAGRLVDKLRNEVKK